MNFQKSCRYNLLIVDSDLLDRKWLADMIINSFDSVACHYANDGVDAIKQIDRIDFDLIITEIVMPRMHGMSLMFELVKKNIHGSVPIIGMTSLSMSDIQIIKQGNIDASYFSDWIRKPLSNKAIIDAISQHIDHVSVNDLVCA